MLYFYSVYVVTHMNFVNKLAAIAAAGGAVQKALVMLVRSGNRVLDCAKAAYFISIALVLWPMLVGALSWQE